VSFASRLIHNLVIERSTAGAEDLDTGHPTYSYATLSAVSGLVQPKSVREVAQLHQAGAVVSDHTIYLLPTAVSEGDRIRFDPDDGRRYEIRGVRDAAGIGHHLEIDARMVQ
jgi:head-tail adaptor